VNDNEAKSQIQGSGFTRAYLWPWRALWPCTSMRKNDNNKAMKWYNNVTLSAVMTQSMYVTNWQTDRQTDRQRDCTYKQRLQQWVLQSTHNAPLHALSITSTANKRSDIEAQNKMHVGYVLTLCGRPSAVQTKPFQLKLTHPLLLPSFYTPFFVIELKAHRPIG